MVKDWNERFLNLFFLRCHSTSLELKPVDRLLHHEQPLVNSWCIDYNLNFIPTPSLLEQGEEEPGKKLDIGLLT